MVLFSSSDLAKSRLCVRCQHPVTAKAQNYETFERMHWVCFHFEYEHGELDPDEPCGDPRCPSRIE